MRNIFIVVASIDANMAPVYIVDGGDIETADTYTILRKLGMPSLLRVRLSLGLLGQSEMLSEQEAIDRIVGMGLSEMDMLINDKETAKGFLDRVVNLGYLDLASASPPYRAALTRNNDGDGNVFYQVKIESWYAE